MSLMIRPLVDKGKKN